MIRAASVAALITLTLTLPLAPAGAVIAVDAEGTRVVPVAVAARLPSATDSGYGEMIAAALGIMVLGFGLTVRRNPQRVSA